jgi:SAM-dependent methyltransferase
MMDLATRDRLKKRIYAAADQDAFGPTSDALQRHLRPGVAVLDAGCGNGTWLLRDFRDRVGYVVGVDAVPPNSPRLLDGFALSKLENIPFLDESFDVVLCYYVVEHLADPHAVFREFHRVLKPGGALIIKTPSLLAPMTLVSKILPHRFHERLKSDLLGVNEDEVFPTLYRCNTTGRMSRTARECGFDQEMLVTVDQTYDYFTFRRLTYALALLYSRVVHLPLAKAFRNQIIGVFRKRGTQA